MKLNNLEKMLNKLQEKNPDAEFIKKMAIALQLQLDNVKGPTCY